MYKNLIIYSLLFLAGVLTGGGAYYIISDNSSQHEHVDEEGKLYTCGMHPEIIETEPGDCPICGMKLLPMKGSGNKTVASGERKILYWRAPMNPNEIYDEPGKSQMGMDLVPVYEDDGGSSGVVSVDGAMLQSMNVKIDHVKKRRLFSEVTTNGILKTDERLEYTVNTKVGGWVEKLYVNFTGQKVKKGEKLVDIYSPELVAAQQELLTSIAYQKAIKNSTESEILTSGNDLVKNSIKKLELFDISSSDIDRLVKTKEVKQFMTIYAPFNGTVLDKSISEGQKITPGMEIIRLADLTNLWLIADVYESDLSKIEVGSQSSIFFSYKPESEYKGKVSFIYPTIDPKTRTVQIRIDINNRSGELKPAMFGNVKLSGKDYGNQLTIPEIAVIRSGKKNLVVLSLGEGKFKPVEVKLGVYSDGYYQVLNGLKNNDMIVKSAQFLLDSESSLRSAVELFSSTDKSEDPSMEMDKGVTTNKNENESNSEVVNEEMNEMEEHNHDPIIRMGVIDLNSIDENNDGKVYQDFMDWNVISDEPGRCPICNMVLQEVSIEEAKKNLEENGFEYK
jgi:Cu(I)/Ag(I) efflux system membrane fusion protein/cobalt-zinc-cadmium efflux system membrane fusion protein